MPRPGAQAWPGRRVVHGRGSLPHKGLVVSLPSPFALNWVAWRYVAAYTKHEVGCVCGRQGPRPPAGQPVSIPQRREVTDVSLHTSVPADAQAVNLMWATKALEEGHH
jgi:hypothetical protein